MLMLLLFCDAVESGCSAVDGMCDECDERDSMMRNEP